MSFDAVELVLRAAPSVINKLRRCAPLETFRLICAKLELTNCLRPSLSELSLLPRHVRSGLCLSASNLFGLAWSTRNRSFESEIFYLQHRFARTHAVITLKEGVCRLRAAGSLNRTVVIGRNWQSDDTFSNGQDQVETGKSLSSLKAADLLLRKAQQAASCRCHNGGRNL